VDPNAPGGPQRLDPGKLYELSLAAVQKLNGPLNPGERLRLVLHVDSGPVKPVVAQLDITIVEAPVIPTTEAAYALLRRQTAGDRTWVECVRFAWGPEAQRVELLNPADLRTEVVRRRAVFQFTDAAPRPAGGLHHPETEPDRFDAYSGGRFRPRRRPLIIASGAEGRGTRARPPRCWPRSRSRR
jgi:hypothetical protein